MLAVYVHGLSVITEFQSRFITYVLPRETCELKMPTTKH